MNADARVDMTVNMKAYDAQAYQAILRRSGGARKENLFALLGSVQDEFGYIPKEIVCDLAARTGVSQTQIYGALTAYRDFKVQL